jgi:ketosteroid isomerase-like protein
MNTANVAGFYNQEPDHAFFDISPLKYADWKEYDAGVQALFKDLKSLKLTVNDDVKVHGEGDWAWVTATLKEDATTKAGKREMATLRWTAVFEKTGDKWLIVHEHVSAPQP